MKKKHFFWPALFVAAILISAFFWIEQQHKEILKAGEYLPALKYLTRDGLQVLSPDSSRVTVLMYFNLNCGHCRYQLDMFEKNMRIFQNQKFVFLTSDAAFLAAGQEKQWSTLSTGDNCSFGMVSRDEFLQAFGTNNTPAIFIFNRRGLLRAGYSGELRLEKLKQILDL